ncbi:MAG: tail fiber domain-containing protein [Burkholderiaceae bacterium]|jgi:hypothetical protein|nr:tail fiber domain-containing protein [Burkholderiaceae bacterium]
MQHNNPPQKVQLPFANSGTKNAIPVPSQITSSPGAASFTDGFPPATMTPLNVGGIPPDGADFNGILNAITAIQQWQSAGGLFAYDAAFAAAVGGYPQGAMLAKADGTGYWINQAENNSANPDTGGAGWIGNDSATTQPPNTSNNLIATTAYADNAAQNAAVNLAGENGSSLVGFIQNGVAAVPRTLQDKCRERVSVLDFGAAADGVYDDTAAFQAALNYQDSSGAIIYVPSGTYVIAGTLTYNNAPKIIGDGWDTTILNCTHNGGGPVLSSSTNALTAFGTILQGLKIMGPGITGGGEYFYDPPRISGSGNRNAIFRDLHIQDFDKCAILMTDSYDCVFENLRLWDIGDWNNPSGPTYGWGILLDRAYWNANNCYASTGNLYQNVSCMHSFRGIGVTDGNQLINSHFKRITGEFCGLTVETFAGNTPPNGWAGPTSFIGTYCEANYYGGFTYRYGTELECYGATYSGGGNNGPLPASSYNRFYHGTASFGAPVIFSYSATFENGAIITDQADTLYAKLAYTSGIYKFQIISCASGSPSMMSIYDNASAGSGVGYIQVIDSVNNSCGRIYFGSVGSSYIDYGNNQAGIFTINSTLTPVSDNALNLGAPGNRWAQIYAGNGSINTSDGRDKQQVRPLSDAERAVAARLKTLVRAFKFNDSVSAKGDDARTHIGLVAQDVQAAFAAEGLNADDYGIFCHDAWEATAEVKDDEGNVQVPAVEAGDRYGLRYEEVLAFIIATL